MLEEPTQVYVPPLVADARFGIGHFHLRLFEYEIARRLPVESSRGLSEREGQSCQWRIREPAEKPLMGRQHSLGNVEQVSDTERSRRVCASRGHLQRQPAFTGERPARCILEQLIAHAATQRHDDRSGA
jgi:hypothetical protein